MKLNDKQREIIVMIMYIFLIIFLCYSSYNEFPCIFIVLIGIVGLFICKKVYSDEKILNKFNTESEIHSLNNWNKAIFYEKVKEKYNLYYEEINREFVNLTIRKYLKVSGIYSFTKNKTLVIIETPKVTLYVIEFVEKIKKKFIDNIPKSNFFNSFLIYKLDIMILIEEMDENLLQYINSEIFCTNKTRGGMKSISIPIVINEKENKLYISKFNKDVYSEVIAFCEARRKIRKKLKNKKII